jgi:hypothetical protein
LTAKTYARTRHERLVEVAEKVGQTIFQTQELAGYVARKVAGAERETDKPQIIAGLSVYRISGGGGNRTRWRAKT